MLPYARYKREIFGLLLLFLLYFALRLISLTSLPIFTDEAIYLRWAQIALNDSTWRFISLTDGKQPLFVWATMVFMKVIDDPLVAGRLVSVVSGFATLIGLVLLSYELFKNKLVSFITGLIYIVYPFAQVYDRMALMDGMVGTFAVWGLYVGVFLVRNLRLDTAYTLGFILGGAALTKSSGFFAAYLLPFTLILFDFKQKKVWQKLVRWGLLAVFAFAISQALYSVLRLSPFFHIIAEKNGTFIYTFQEWITHPVEFFLPNLKTLLEWFSAYFNIFIIFVLAGFVSKKFRKENLLLLSYFAVPFLILALFGKTLYPRHFYFMTLSLIPIASFGLYNLIMILKKRTRNDLLAFLSVPVILAYPFYVSIQFATNPPNAPIAKSDYGQYVRDWPAGWGVKESITYLTENSRDKKIYVFTAGTFGLMPASLELYLNKNPNIVIKGIWPINDGLPKEIEDASSEGETYLLFYQPCPACIDLYGPPWNWPSEKVFQAERGRLALYKVIPR